MDRCLRPTTSHSTGVGVVLEVGDDALAELLGLSLVERGAGDRAGEERHDGRDVATRAAQQPLPQLTPRGTADHATPTAAAGAERVERAPTDPRTEVRRPSGGRCADRRPVVDLVQ